MKWLRNPSQFHLFTNRSVIMVMGWFFTIYRQQATKALVRLCAPLIFACIKQIENLTENIDILNNIQSLYF